MYLREFDLDLPYALGEIVDLIMIEKKCELEEVMPYLPQDIRKKLSLIMEEKKCNLEGALPFYYDENWHDRRYKFRLETRCVASMFERLFGKMKTKEAWKISARCVDEIRGEEIVSGEVIYVQVKFDYNKYINSNEYEKKKIILDTLYEGIKKVVKEEGWDIEPFEKAYLQVKEKDYINTWVWKKPKYSPNRKYTGEVLCEHEVEYIDISIIIRNKQGEEVSRKKIISEAPHEFRYVEHLGNLKWISNQELVLINRNEKKKVKAKFNL